MKRAVLAVASIVLICGCKEEIVVPPPKELAGGDIASLLPINVGDVEAQVHLYCDVPETLGDAENIDVERTNTRLYDLGMVTVDLYPPYPESIPLRIWMEKELPRQEVVVVLRGSVKRDDVPIAPVELVIVKDTPHELDITTADALAGLEGTPETTLILASVDALLLPPTTDVSTIDIATAQATPETQSVLLSNPVRINFHPAKDTP